MSKAVTAVVSVILAFLLLVAGMVDMINGGHSWEAGSAEAEFVKEAYGALYLVRRSSSLNTLCSDEEEELIWDTLLEMTGNPYGAAGAMGNLHAESGLASDHLQGDIPYSALSKQYTKQVDSGEISKEAFVYSGPNGGGYGLAQWTWWSYKRDLYDLAQSMGASVGSVRVNLELIRQKLNGDKASTLTALQNATSVREASDAFLHLFECPADQSEEVEEKRAEYSQSFYDKYALGSNGYINDPLKTNLGLVEWANMAYESGWGYVWGTYGQVMSEGLLESKIKQYPDNVGIYEDFIRNNYMGKHVADCVGLIKGYSWYDPATGNVGYATNGMPDVGAGGIYQNATVKGLISTMPEIPGLILSMGGHDGIYVGDGWVIQAAGTMSGVIKTRLENDGWVCWCMSPYITYVETDD